MNRIVKYGERSVSKPQPPTPAGHNNPPSAIEVARTGAIADISKWMTEHPVIQTEAEAREAKPFLDRGNAALESIETERDGKVRPLNDQVKLVNAEYKQFHNTDGKKSGKLGIFDRIVNELRERVQTYLQAEEDRRIEASREAAKVAAAAEQAARDAEAREREAKENAAAGEIGVDVLAAAVEADTAFDAFERAERAAYVAIVDTRVKIGGGFLKPIGLRTERKLVLTDAPMALADIGVTEGIREAILSGARLFRKLRGELPRGVIEVEERVL